jgi:hypothetical protein
MNRAATPFLWSDIGDGFGEVPAVTVKILRVVLAFAVGMILRFSQDNGAVLPRSLAVTLGIFNANLNGVRVVGCHRAFGDSKAAIASSHLYAVIGDAKTDSEAKSFCQPIGGYAGVWINEHGNHGARWHGPVESHLETLSFMAGLSETPTIAASPKPIYGKLRTNVAVFRASPAIGHLPGFTCPPVFDERIRQG